MQSIGRNSSITSSTAEEETTTTTRAVEEDDVRGDVAGFCASVVPFLRQTGAVGSIDTAANQLRRLRPAATEFLIAGARDVLLLHIDRLETRIELVRSDATVGGWSDVDVIRYVSELCEADDLFGWTAQP